MVKAAEKEKKAATHSTDTEKKVEAAAKKAEMKAKGDGAGGSSAAEQDAGSSATKPAFKRPEMSSDQFMEVAKPLTCKIMDGDNEVSSLELKPRLNNTGSVGWNCNEKLVINVAGEDLNVVAGINFTVSGSKPRKGGKK